ncbi:PAS domain-containing sensor histidine kinase [Endozoicomonas sp. OPT23]|uniref:HAMP domain-containing sensor histidine kinase n=1 Tax=Endozoicomonas sp. OPT23 TaxID=2072845 RepID=UPI00129A574D|nr:HAMP domain-containing sensor histidine kinase [Endozoicomonas sp. OPT23]MRI33509.1 PAS domain-containing sensor histidine kinase [Endozoicomonas sp. OPT23]
MSRPGQIFYRYLSGLSLSKKLLGGLVSVVLTIALIATSAVMLSAYLMSKHYFLPDNVQAMVKILSEDSVLSTLTGNVTRAEQTLAAASEYSQIRSLAIYNPDGKLHASYNNQPEHFFIPYVVPENINADYQYLSKIEQSPGEEYTLYIQADPALPMFFFFFMGLASFIILVSFVLLTSLSTGFIKRFVTLPVLHLIRVTNRVSEQENYSIRARRFHNDEIGKLTNTFNAMLSRIELRDQQLTEERDKAEKAGLKAQELAAEMQQSNSKLAREVEVRSRVERKLTQFQNYLNDIIDSMPSALLAIDDNMTVNQCNKAATELASLPFDQMIGKPLEHILPFLYQCHDQLQTALQEQKFQRIEKLPIELECSKNYLDLIIYPLSRDETSGAVILIDNITRRHKLEEMMIQTEKMMSVGGLAAGMAHEINNPLGAIIQGSQNIRRRVSKELPVNVQAAEEQNIDLSAVNQYLETRGIIRFLDNIQDAGVRASKIVSNMLLFSRGGEAVLTPANLTDLIERTIEIASNDFNLKKGLDFMHIRVHKELDPMITEVPCIASELQQVLLNLLKNAAFAIHNRRDKTELGLITIRTQQEKNKVIISVSDNGSGMDGETRKRIFEPFFTTKEVGNGTGLGLSVSYFIITAHHKGTMSVFSVPDKGTEFSISLPLEYHEEAVSPA